MTFQELGVSEEIRQAIEELGFVTPMPVQEAVIPFQLQNDDNLIALAQTGTGKTAAYGIPLLQNIDANSNKIQAIILSPTRELCLQITDDLNDFAKYMRHIRIVPVYGGTGMEQQIRALKRGVQIVVATPGRLIDLKNRGIAHIESASSIVLDEADRMLDMGFKDDIDDIFNAIEQTGEQGKHVKKLMFSATMSKEVENVARQYLGTYKEIVVGSRNEGAENVRHIFYLVHAKDKYAALKRVVDYYPKIYAIIFCRTKLETQDVADKLIRDGYNAEALHGDLSQPQRDLTMQKFRQHTIQLLVATDVAARGLDVNDLTHVINYGLPEDTEAYTHRSGRTGRAGKNGTSISIIHTKERSKVRNIEKTIGKKFVDGQLPEPHEICMKQLYKVMDDIMKADVDEELIAPFIGEINRRFAYVDKEDVIKKIVSMTFGRFLSYYADAEDIERPSAKAAEDPKNRRKGQKNRETERGYVRLFINLGKDTGFYPGVCMQFLNKYLGGRQKVGHIELHGKYAFIEIPERDAENVMATVNGVVYRGITVRCNPSDGQQTAESYPSAGKKGKRKEDWRQFFSGNSAAARGAKAKGKKRKK